ncbi:MAG: carboxymuconolactone decarboxylase family protein [Chloroflexi bacterium]|nr:carboxymuconolactone decarboxylase family protein [Chloroflexota bacterium]
MARISYVDGQSAPPEVGDVFAKLEARGAKVINLYRAMGHSQAALLPFIKMGNSLLTKARLEPRLREMAILRVAILSGSRYEWQQHEALARELGVTEAQVADLAEWEASSGFDDKEKAALTFVDEVAQQIAVSDDTFARLGEHFDETEIVELTLSIGFWGMVARFLVALQVDLEEGSGTSGQELLGGK